MSVPPGKVAGTLPIFWRAALFVGILSAHGLGFAFLSSVSVSGQKNAGAPAVLQASWIAAPMRAIADPEPAAAPRSPSVKPPQRVRPKKPVLAKPAETPEPLAQTIVAPDTPPEEDALADEPATTLASAPVAEASVVASAVAAGDPVIPPSHADYLSNPRPEYPTLSRAQGEQGVVYLRVRVSAEGSAHSVTLNKSCGHERLDRAAIEAVRRWRFIPARRAGHPVMGVVIVPIQFNLRS
ncbi:MAG: energy transducer TonB [Zoogloeaceae bacterium]|jgi:protein TonB|nr:energy transducer TonB [Zoogloeaceae bacterium]